MRWKLNKLHNFELKKNVSRKKERKKKNIGYRVASNERRLKNDNDNSKNFVTFQLKMTQRGAHIKAILGNLKLTSLNLIPLIEPKLEVVGGKDLSRGVNRTREGARCCK